MDWTQTLMIIGSVAASAFTVYRASKSDVLRLDAQHREDMSKIDEKWERMFTKLDSYHRADMRSMDNKWERTFNKTDKKINKMDEKWAVLFEKYLSK